MDYRMPLYIQLQDSIIKKIDEKKYLPGEAIPSERKMAEAYGVNRMTVKRAVSKLVEEGYLVCKPGSGTYVAQRDKKKIDLDNSNEAGNTGITATLRKGGMEVKNRLFGTGEITGSKYLGYKLGISDDEMIYGIYRVRSEGDIPFAVEYTYVPAKYFDDLDEFDFAKVSLYDYMEAKGHMPCHFGQKLVICEANERLAELLQVERGTAIYKINYQGADADYNIVEFTMSYLNPAYTKFRFDVEVS